MGLDPAMNLLSESEAITWVRNHDPVQLYTGREYPVFGIGFAENPENDGSELDVILTSNLREFITQYPHRNTPTPRR